MFERFPWYGGRRPERHERPGKKAMALRIGELGNVEIGVQGECDAREILLDVTEWLEIWPDAVFLVTHRRPTEYHAYNVGHCEIRDGGVLCWTVAEEDVAIAGRGEIQVRAYEGETLVKSISGRTVIRPSVGAGEDPPEPADDWFETVSRAGADAIKGAKDAEIVAERLAEVLYGVIGNDVFTGTREEWEAFLDGLISSLEQARAAAASAEQNAETVEGYMEDAEAFREEYQDKLESLVVLLRSIKHKLTEDPDGWVHVDMEGLDAEEMESFPTIQELLERLEDLDAALTRAQTTNTSMTTLLNTVQTKLNNGDFVGATGARGPAGRNGKDGKDGFVIKGTYATLSALEAGAADPQPGDAYGVGENGNYTVYIWDGVKNEWVSWGSLTGGSGGTDETEVNALIEARLASLISGTDDDAEAGTAEKALYDKIEEIAAAAATAAAASQAQSAFDTRITQILADTDTNSAATAAFRQAVYDSVFPVGFSYVTDYTEASAANLPKIETGVFVSEKAEAAGDGYSAVTVSPNTIPANPAALATQLKVKCVWEKTLVSTMGYIGGYPKYAAGLLRWTRTK